MYRKYKLDETYFEEVNTEDKAYFLGLLYADGYNQVTNKGKYISLSLQVSDIHILRDFKKALGSTQKLCLLRAKKKTHSDQARLQINSKKLCEDLVKLGCIQNKSLMLTFPTFLPKHLIHHFIRGYFDGDGCVWEGKKYRKVFKDSTCKFGQRERTVHNVKFNITGTLHFITGVQNILVSSIGFKKNKLNVSKAIANCVQLEYSGRKQMKRFYDFLYKDYTVFLNRKKSKFESIINCAIA